MGITLEAQMTDTFNTIMTILATIGVSTVFALIAWLAFGI